MFSTPLVWVAVVAADLVVETIDSQVTEAGGIGAEMVVWVAIILAVDIALISPIFVSIKKREGFFYKKITGGRDSPEEEAIAGIRAQGRNEVIQIAAEADYYHPLASATS